MLAGLSPGPGHAGRFKPRTRALPNIGCRSVTPVGALQQPAGAPDPGMLAGLSPGPGHAGRFKPRARAGWPV